MNEESIRESVREARKPKTKNYIIVLIGFVVLLGIVLLFTGVGEQDVLGLSGEAPPALPDVSNTLVSETPTGESSPNSDPPSLPGF